jgi:hypothetical protein
MSRILSCQFLIIALTASYCAGQTNNQIFEKMAGPAVVMDGNIDVKFLEGRPGRKFMVDSDKDGRADVIYLIDSDEKHLGTRSPLLVKIVDEDGDMYLTGEGDLDSDLYVADWYGDGTIDRVVDYRDMDGDNDVDEQYLYQWVSMEYPYFSPRTYGGKSYCVSWTGDYGDDNRLWYHTNYEYGQRLTQWLTDFNGDEMFVYTLYFDFEAGTLTPACEIAFSFYDHDGDSLSEEAVRFEGAKLVAESLRYSMDIDNDADALSRHDYDLSVTSLGPITLPESSCIRLDIRGIITEPVFNWTEMRLFAKQQKWGRTLLTWDENDNNIDPRPGRMHNERWEGILNHGSEFMPQVGGPTCGPYNKRNEVDKDRSGEFKFYLSPVDSRLHLFGAEIGWIKVDYDYDDRIDMILWMEDTDQNGFFDTWKYDNDADGDFELIYRIPFDTATTFPFNYETLREAYLPLLKDAADQNRRIIGTLKAVLGKFSNKSLFNPVEEFFNKGLTGYGRDFRLGDKIRNSPEGQRYYEDLIRIRYWNNLRETESVSVSADFPAIEKLYAAGRFDEAAEMLEDRFLHSADGKP